MKVGDRVLTWKYVNGFQKWEGAIFSIEGQITEIGNGEVKCFAYNTWDEQEYWFPLENTALDSRWDGHELVCLKDKSDESL